MVCRKHLDGMGIHFKELASFEVQLEATIGKFWGILKYLHLMNYWPERIAIWYRVSWGNKWGT